MKEIYCDNSATTPIYPAVIKEMEQYFTKIWGNPSSIYARGRIAKEALIVFGRTKLVETKGRYEEIFSKYPPSTLFISIIFLFTPRSIKEAHLRNTICICIFFYNNRFLFIKTVKFCETNIIHKVY